MSDIIYNASKVKEYENLMALCDFAGEDRSFGETLWADLLLEPALYQEYIYYLIHGTIEGKISYQGYSLLDLYVWQMDLANLRNDTGKNTAECNKISMILRSFRAMLDLKKDPEAIIKKMNEGRGMDKF